MSRVCLPTGSTVAGALTTFVFAKNALACGIGAVITLATGSPLAALGMAVSAVALAAFALLAIVVMKKIAAGEGPKTIRQFIKNYAATAMVFVAVLFAAIIGRLKNVLPNRSQDQNLLRQQNLPQDGGQEVFGVGTGLMKETIPTIEVAKDQVYYEMEENLFNGVFPVKKDAFPGLRSDERFDLLLTNEEFDLMYPFAKMQENKPSAPLLNNDQEYKQTINSLSLNEFKEMICILDPKALQEVIISMDSNKFGDFIGKINKNEESLVKMALNFNQNTDSSVNMTVSNNVINDNNYSFSFNNYAPINVFNYGYGNQQN